MNFFNFKDEIFNKIYELSLLNTKYIVLIIRMLGNVTSLNDNLVNFIYHNIKNECTPSQVKLKFYTFYLIYI